MAYNQQFLFCDTSTYANFFSWASAFSTNLTTFGWAQSNDTAQVMWSGMNLTAVSMSGSNATYTYNSLTGLPLAIGRALTITGMLNSVNNKTVVITALTGTTSGTFTVVNAVGVNETGSSGVVTAQTTVPATSTYVTEIWTPNDGQTTFFLKLEYGAGTTAHIRGTLCSSTNGASVAAGFITTLAPWDANIQSIANPSTTAQYECNFSGGPGRFSAMMWRNAPGNTQVLLSVERSVNSSGVYTNTHVTYMQTVNYTGGNTGRQQTLLFGVGMGPVTLAQSGTGNSNLGFVVRSMIPNTGGLSGNNTSGFNGTIPFDTVTPSIGLFDYPLTTVGCCYSGDVAEAVPFQTTLYGATRTYMPSSKGVLGLAITSLQSVCMRYD